MFQKPAIRDQTQQERDAAKGLDVANTYKRDLIIDKVASIKTRILHKLPVQMVTSLDVSLQRVRDTRETIHVAYETSINNCHKRDNSVAHCSEAYRLILSALQPAFDLAHATLELFVEAAELMGNDAVSNKEDFARSADAFLDTLNAVKGVTADLYDNNLSTKPLATAQQYIASKSVEVGAQLLAANEKLSTLRLELGQLKPQPKPVLHGFKAVTTTSETDTEADEIAELLKSMGAKP